MIRFVRGDIFESGAEMLVNPVDCVGGCGKGLALEFMRRFPDNYVAYRKECMNHFRIGRMFVTAYTAYIVNFATKIDWQEKSRLVWIVSGLRDLRRTIDNLKPQSVAIPALGCGCGGLRWVDVKPEIEKALGGLAVDIMVYEPMEKER